MAADVVTILQKGGHPLTTLRVSFSGERAVDPPHRFTRIAREKYCSVWHSMRPDIDFVTSFDLRA
jgi:uncharacterized OsmC-like protein